MKKVFLFLILILISCFAGVFAETGYNGIKWNANPKQISSGKNAEKWQPTEEMQVISCESIILGAKSIKAFLFKNKKLTGISYLLNNYSLNELLSKFDNANKIIETNITFYSLEELTEGLEHLKKENKLPRSFDNSKKQNDTFLLLMGLISAIEISENIEKVGYKNIETTEENIPRLCHLYIYDYNDDTRTYILDNKESGIVFVAYVPHEQDY